MKSFIRTTDGCLWTKTLKTCFVTVIDIIVEIISSFHFVLVTSVDFQAIIGLFWLMFRDFEFLSITPELYVVELVESRVFVTTRSGINLIRSNLSTSCSSSIRLLKIYSLSKRLWIVLIFSHHNLWIDRVFSMLRYFKCYKSHSCIWINKPIHSNWKLYIRPGYTIIIYLLFFLPGVCFNCFRFQ